MTYKAVVFDLDGTLIHSLPEYRYALLDKTLTELGKSATLEEIDKFWFEARRNTFIEGVFGVNSNDFWSVYRKYDLNESREHFTKPYEDISFIKELKNKGFKLGIVTGAPEHIADMEIKMIGENLFDSVILARPSHGIQPKPHPQGLYECLKILGIKESEAIYVGNADEDIELAVEAKVFDVLIDRGEYLFPWIKPSLKIKSLYELRSLLSL